MWDPTCLSFSMFLIYYTQKIRGPIMWDPTLFGFFSVLDRLQTKARGPSMWDPTFLTFCRFWLPRECVLDRLHSKDTGSHHVGPHLVKLFQRFGSIANKGTGCQHVGPRLSHFLPLLINYNQKIRGPIMWDSTFSSFSAFWIDYTQKVRPASLQPILQTTSQRSIIFCFSIPMQNIHRSIQPSIRRELDGSAAEAVACK